MLEIISTVVNKEGKVSIGDINYVINHTIQNGYVNNITCYIYKNIFVPQETPEGIQQIETSQNIGHIHRENSRLSMEFDSTVNPIDFISVFEEIEKEIDAENKDPK